MPQDDEYSRRSSDGQIYKLTEQIGQCVGRMESFCNSQTDINNRIQENIDKLDSKHDDNHIALSIRVDSLESSRKTIVGVAIGSGMASGGVLASILKYLGIVGTGGSP